MAEILGVPYPKFWQTMGETFEDRSLGNFKENIYLEVCRRLNIDVNKTQIEQILTLNYAFTKASLIPEPEVLKAVAHLKSSGFYLGLITNCGSAVPMLFPESPLAQYIDVPIFSCEERIKKPEPRIYEIACERLKVKPQECLYVGDGSSEELTGAAAVGMRPIHKRADLTDVYDPHRPEIENWQGIVIDEISEVHAIVSR